MQAEIGRYKLKNIEKINQRFREIALFYISNLQGVVEVPCENSKEYAIYHNFVIKTDKRDELKDFLISKSIDVKVRYPIPLQHQGAQIKRGVAPKADEIADRMLSLPIFPEIEKSELLYVVNSIKEFFNV